MTTKPYPGLVDYSLLALLAAIFGAAFMFIAVAVNLFPPMTLVALRQGLATLVFVVAMVWTRQRFPALGKVWIYILAGAVLGNALPFFLIAWGQQQVDVGLAAILTSTTPIMALIIGQIFTQDEKFTLPKLIGVVLGFCGIVVLIGADNLLALGDDQLRQYALLCAALSYSINAFVLKKLAGLPRMATIGAVMLVSFLVMLPFSLGFEHPWTINLEWWPVVAVIALGLVSTGIGNLLRFEIVGRQGALFLTQISYLIPPFGLFWAWLVLGEVPTPRVYLALFFILAGIFAVRIGEQRAKRKIAKGEVMP